MKKYLVTLFTSVLLSGCTTKNIQSTFFNVDELSLRKVSSTSEKCDIVEKLTYAKTKQDIYEILLGEAKKIEAIKTKVFSMNPNYYEQYNEEGVVFKETLFLSGRAYCFGRAMHERMSESNFKIHTQSPSYKEATLRLDNQLENLQKINMFQTPLQSGHVKGKHYLDLINQKDTYKGLVLALSLLIN